MFSCVWPLAHSMKDLLNLVLFGMDFFSWLQFLYGQFCKQNRSPARSCDLHGTNINAHHTDVTSNYMLAAALHKQAFLSWYLHSTQGFHPATVSVL